MSSQFYILPVMCAKIAAVWGGGGIGKNCEHSHVNISNFVMHVQRISVPWNLRSSSDKATIKVHSKAYSYSFLSLLPSSPQMRKSYIIVRMGMQ